MTMAEHAFFLSARHPNQSTDLVNKVSVIPNNASLSFKFDLLCQAEAGTKKRVS